MAAEQDAIVEADVMIPLSAMISNSKHCEIIQVHYEFKVVAEVEGSHLNFETIIPITIFSAPMGSDTGISYTKVPFAPIHPMAPSAPLEYDPCEFIDLKHFSNPIEIHLRFFSAPLFEQVVVTPVKPVEKSKVPDFLNLNRNYQLTQSDGLGWKFSAKLPSDSDKK